jgi:hypothetical protein
MTDYIHHTPGRLRTVWPHLKNDPVQAKATEVALRRIKGVISVKASALTGNLFIRYDAGHTRLDALLESVQQVEQTYGSRDAMRFPSRAPQRALRESASHVPHAATGKLGGMLLGMLVEKCLERSAIALVAAVL